MRGSIKTVGPLLLALTAAPLAAQSEPNVNAYNWKYDGRTSVPVKMYQYFPSQCRPALARAVTTINAIGSRFTFTHSPTVTTTQNLEGGQNNSDAIVSYGRMVNAGAVAEAPPIPSSRNTATSYGPSFLVSDADVVVNSNLIFYHPSDADSAGKYFCPAAANQPVPGTFLSNGAPSADAEIDFEALMLHELLHVAGLAHFSSSSCTMYNGDSPYTQSGARRTTCLAERNVLRSTAMYGAR